MRVSARKRRAVWKESTACFLWRHLCSCSFAPFWVLVSTVVCHLFLVIVALRLAPVLAFILSLDTWKAMEKRVGTESTQKSWFWVKRRLSIARSQFNPLGIWSLCSGFLRIYSDGDKRWQKEKKKMETWLPPGPLLGKHFLRTFKNWPTSWRPELSSLNKDKQQATLNNIWKMLPFKLSSSELCSAEPKG